MALKCVVLSVLTLLSTTVSAGAVIIHAGAPIRALDSEQVRRVFLGREATLGGVPVLLIYQREGALRQSFEAQVLGKTGPELTSYWSRLIFTGKARAPTDAAGDAEVKARVLSTPGAVGYVNDSAVDASVKVLFRF